MTRDRINAKGEGLVFKDPKEAEKAYRTGQAELHARVKVRISEVHIAEETRIETPVTAIVETTVGRAILSSILPKGLPFELINRSLGKK
jgi:DNA-directed RNA polymerase subunit beta'